MSRRRAMTLVEMLGVLVILALAMGMFFGNAMVTAGAARSALAVTALADGLEHARMIARARGGAEISLDRSVRIRCADGSASEIHLPAGWTASFVGPEMPPEHDRVLALDARGFGPDCEVVLHHADASTEHRIRLRVLGIVGQILEVSR